MNFTVGAISNGIGFSYLLQEGRLSENYEKFMGLVIPTAVSITFYVKGGLGLSKIIWYKKRIRKLKLGL
jgi:hypothetical protein